VRCCTAATSAVRAHAASIGRWIFVKTGANRKSCKYVFRYNSENEAKKPLEDLAVNGNDESDDSGNISMQPSQSHSGYWLIGQVALAV
jgi:hypothetical protein